VTFHNQPACDGPARIAIVGGGPGGLFTAWHLERLAAAPLAVTILEASDRLGGKVLTPSFAKAAIRYEAGAAELYDYSPVAEDPLRQLVRSLGLPTVAMGGSAAHAGGRLIANLDDLAAACGEEGCAALRAFDTWARSAMTPTEFYESGSDHATSAAPAGRFDERLASIRSEPARHYVATMLKSDLATEPAVTSTSYGLQNYLMNDPRYMRLYCIAGGNEQLITALASRPDEALVAAAVATLPEPFRLLGDHVLEARVHRWQGAVNGVPGGWQPLPVDRRHRPAAGYPNLFVVGDYLYDTTLNGVLDSAEHVAGWLAAEGGRWGRFATCQNQLWTWQTASLPHDPMQAPVRTQPGPGLRQTVRPPHSREKPGTAPETMAMIAREADDIPSLPAGATTERLPLPGDSGIDLLVVPADDTGERAGTAADLAIARRQMALEWAIVVLLVAQTAILVVELLARGGAS
jgi:hypothetical protein